jgi:hypothetical protein
VNEESTRIKTPARRVRSFNIINSFGRRKA